MKDILKKENPSGHLDLYQPEEDYSSFYKKKRDVKEERKSGNQSSNKSVIKKAVERIARYKRDNPTVKSKVAIKSGKTPGRFSIAKKPSTTKALTIKTFQEYKDWYDKHGFTGKTTNKGKVSTRSKTPKRSVSKNAK